MRTAAVLCLISLILSLAVTGNAAMDDCRATLDGNPLPDIPVMSVDGRPFVGLSGLKSLHASAVFDRASSTATIALGRRVIVLTAGAAEGSVDGRTVTGAAPPFIRNGEFWFAADWLERFELKTSWDTRRHQLNLSWAKPYLLGVWLEGTETGQRLRIEASGPIDADVFPVAGPDRLVVDLAGLTAYDHLFLDDRENEYYQKLRTGVNRPGVLRLVADLRCAAGFHVDTNHAKDGLLYVEFNALINEVGIVAAPDGQKVIIGANARLSWTTTALVNPERIVVEISRAMLTIPAGTQKGDGKWLRSVEYKPLDGDRVQVQANLAKPITCAIAPAPEGRSVIEIQPLQNMGRLRWRENNDGFVLESDGVLTITAKSAYYPDRLILNIFHAVTAPDEGDREAGVVKHYRIGQIQPGLTEIIFDLRYHADYKIEYSADRRRATFIFDPSPLAGKVIVLDPGHGGFQPGAINTRLNLREKDINLDVAVRLNELLSEAGAIVYLTRIGDDYVPLYDRGAFGIKMSADVFLSIHANSLGDSAANGVETFYYPGKTEDRRLARLILDEMVDRLILLPRGAKAHDYAVLRQSLCVSVLVELGFLSNPEEAARLATAEFRQQSAQAIYRALTRFFRGEGDTAAPSGPGLTK